MAGNKNSRIPIDVVDEALRDIEVGVYEVVLNIADERTADACVRAAKEAVRQILEPGRR